MSSITIFNLDDKLKASFHMRAARHVLSMEQEARNVLQNTWDTDAENSDAAAEQFAVVRAYRQRAGRPTSTEDFQIAAIPVAAKLKLATRNTKDFEAIEGLQVVNSWQLHW